MSQQARRSDPRGRSGSAPARARLAWHPVQAGGGGPACCVLRLFCLPDGHASINGADNTATSICLKVNHCDWRVHTEQNSWRLPHNPPRPTTPEQVNISQVLRSSDATVRVARASQSSLPQHDDSLVPDRGVSCCSISFQVWRPGRFAHDRGHRTNQIRCSRSAQKCVGSVVRTYKQRCRKCGGYIYCASCRRCRRW